MRENVDILNDYDDAVLAGKEGLAEGGQGVATGDLALEEAPTVDKGGKLSIQTAEKNLRIQALEVPVNLLSKWRPKRNSPGETSERQRFRCYKGSDNLPVHNGGNQALANG